jgi:hypothetical protein
VSALSQNLAASRFSWQEGQRDAAFIQLLEQRLRLDEVARVEALGEGPWGGAKVARLGRAAVNLNNGRARSARAATRSRRL